MSLAYEAGYPPTAKPAPQLTPDEERRQLIKQIVQLQRKRQEALREIQNLCDALQPEVSPFQRALLELDQARKAGNWDKAAYLEWVLPSHWSAMMRAQAELTELHQRLGNKPGSFQAELSDLEARLREVTLRCIQEAEARRALPGATGLSAD